MNVSVFVENYEKYISEISALVDDRFSPILVDFKNKNPRDLIDPDSRFPDESSARGFLWNLFIEAVNKQSQEKITIDIEKINSVEDIELFFALLAKERILYHPEMSFSGIMNTDLYGIKTTETFTKQESERLDKLMEQCFKIAEEENIDIFKTSMRITKLIRGEPKKGNPNNN